MIDGLVFGASAQVIMVLTLSCGIRAMQSPTFHFLFEFLLKNNTQHWPGHDHMMLQPT
jgi:hypothetical protein